jgi:hypothetical protein
VDACCQRPGCQASVQWWCTCACVPAVLPPCPCSKESISGGYLQYLQQQEANQLEEAFNELSSKAKQQQQQQGQR